MPSSMTTEDKLKRILYVNNAGCQYFVGNPDEYQKDLTKSRRSIIAGSLKNGLKEIFSVLDSANGDKNLPRRSVIFLFLAKLMKYDDMTPQFKSEVTNKVLQLCCSDEEFFDFIKYYTESRQNCKLPTSVEKLVQKFYHNKTAKQVAELYARFNSLHKWTHKDLIKLGHVKPDTDEKQSLFKYILKKELNATVSKEEEEVLDIAKKSCDLRRTNDPKVAVSLLSELKLPIKQTSQNLHENPEVWAAAMENMTIQEILPYLGKLYKLGLLKPDTTISKNLEDLFTNAEKVKGCGIHPVDVLSYAKRLEKGGKPMDVQLLNHLQNEKKLSEQYLKKAKTRTEAKCPHILQALQTCFDIACKNITPTNKQYLVAIDVSAKVQDALCIGNKVLTFLEAAVTYAYILLKVEQNVTIVTYKEDTVKPLTVKKDVSFSELLEKVKSEESTYSMVWAPIEWALAQKKTVDVFTTFVHSEHVQLLPEGKKSPKNLETMETFRKNMNLPNSRLIMFCLNAKSLFAFHNLNEVPLLLDIFGFDAVACKVAECFSRGTFS